MRKRPRLSILLAFALCAQCFAQQPAVPSAPASPSDDDKDESVRITSNLVQLDFVVTDKDGRQVTDLTAEDVELLEDGRPQKLIHFSYVTAGPDTAATPAPQARPADRSAPPPGPVRRENVRRTIAVVVDDLGISFQTMATARAALRRFVEEQVQPGDLVAVVRTGGEVGALQQFTNDKRQLLAAVERLRWNPCSRRGVSAVPPVQQDAYSQRWGQSTVTGPGVGAGDRPVCASYTMAATVAALRFIIGGMRDLPGRKSLILLSDSIPLADQDPTQGGPLSVAGLGAGGDAFRTTPAADRRNYVGPLQRISELAIRASVVIYGVDTRGLPPLTAGAADETGGLSAQQHGEILSARGDDFIGGREGAEMLTHQTGGFLVNNNNDIRLGLGRIMNDLRGYYLAGYRPSAETFNRRFHKITARVRTRPGLSVRTRSGFYGVPEEGVRPERTTSADRFVAALTSPFAAPDVELRLTPVFTNTAEAGSVLRTLLHIDPRGLTFREESGGWQSADLILRGVLFGDNGKIVDEHRDSFTVRLRGATLARVRQSGLDYVFNMPVRRPGAYQFRVAVTDPASGRVGSAGQFVEAPDVKKERLALSGLVVRAGAPADGGGAVAGAFADAADGAAPAQESEATPSLRRFRQQMLLDYSYLVFHARADRTTSRPHLTVRVQLFRDGRPVFDRESPVEVARLIDPVRAVAAGRLRLGDDLTPGEYVLQITVMDLLAEKYGRAATQWIDFEIVK